MKKKLTLRGGGFHNAGAIIIMAEKSRSSHLYWVSPGTQKSLEKHYCGVSGCKCQSWPKVMANREGGDILILCDEYETQS